MNKDSIIDLYNRYETELQVTLPEFSQELSELIFQSTKVQPQLNYEKATTQNKSPHFTCDFATPISRHTRTKKTKPTKPSLETCPNCFEVHSLALRQCTICNEQHSGCCEIIIA